ncbi:DUF2515 family protein [Paenibacillus physcomitrellae]|uniref:DUF2515 domain-containing protein n=1 Tax=Paenibacillus physcomitrellae TaxID=1619311 RepID=A0ABQ1G390_9BACL|nr:DUF2515 family protein [Paenibacillus physcomitrellae]GGA35233.1 hypothetical protein GCM10010917_20560 [Paenibacillus physcomitrellae]
MRHSEEHREEKPWDIWRRILLSLPKAAWHSASGRAVDLASSGRLLLVKRNLDWNETAARFVRSSLEELLRRSGQLGRQEPRGQNPQSSHRSAYLSPEDQEIVADIELAVRQNNRNNVTRTAAYLKLYRDFPELHWAFLAHMVSRNAGWNMSDLKGGQADLLLGDTDVYRTYRFLERSNALIFQDAYPQLLLYAHSKRFGKSLFHLLPQFHVSRFMQPFWDYFWLSRSSSLLAVGLIINEQNYIEKRVVKHPFFQQTVTHKAPFLLGGLSGVNQVVFPYGTVSRSGREQPRLGGRIMSHFAGLNARIHLGKHLYALLFGLPEVRLGTEQFAFSIPHTGSRADYWPDLFSPSAREARTLPRQGAELLQNRFRPDGTLIYSPPLLDCFEDTPYEPISREDWFQDGSALGDIHIPVLPLLCEITAGHRMDILKRAYVHDAVAGARRWDKAESQ